MSAFPCSGVSTTVAVFQKKIETSVAATTTEKRMASLSARRRNRGDDSRPGILVARAGDGRCCARHPVVHPPAIPRLLQTDEEDLRLHLRRLLRQQRHLEDRLVRVRLVDLERRGLDRLGGVVDDRDVPREPLPLRQALAQLGVCELVRFGEILPGDRSQDEPPGNTPRLLVERDLLPRREDLRPLVRERRLLRRAGVAVVGHGERDHAGSEDKDGGERDLTLGAGAHALYDGLPRVQLDEGDVKRVKTRASRARYPTPRATRRRSRPSSRSRVPLRGSPASGSRPRGKLPPSGHRAAARPSRSRACPSATSRARSASLRAPRRSSGSRAASRPRAGSGSPRPRPARRARPPPDSGTPQLLFLVAESSV